MGSGQRAASTTMPRRSRCPTSFLTIRVGKTRKVNKQFLLRRPTTEVELQHFVRSLRRFLACPHADEQTGQHAQVDLDRQAVLAVGQQMPTAQNAFEPAEIK